MTVGHLMGIYMEELEKYGCVPEAHTNGVGLNHAFWMAHYIGFGEPMDAIKEARWIGYLQALLNTGGVYTLEELKEHSRQHLK